MDTLLTLAGAEVPGSPGGRPLLDAAWRTLPQGLRDAIFCEWDDDRTGLSRSLRCIRTATHKLVRYASDPHTVAELHDPVADPHEASDRFADPASADVRADLEARLRIAYGDALEFRPAVPREAP